MAYIIYIRNGLNDTLIGIDVNVTTQIKDISNNRLFYHGTELKDKEAYLSDLGIGPECVLEERSYMTKNEFSMWLFEKLLHKYGNCIQFSRNPNLTIEILEKYQHEPIWNWAYDISSNPAVTIEMLERFPSPEYPWYWGRYGLSSNPALTLEMLERFSGPEHQWYWGRNGVSSNKALTLDILKRFQVPWSWSAISANPAVTVEMVQAFPDAEWVWGANSLSKYMKINVEIIKMFEDKWNWGFDGLSCNEHLTLEILETFSDAKYEWHWGDHGISSNPALTVEIIKRFPDKVWSVFGISRNKVLTLEIMDLFIDAKWNTYALSFNKNLTTEMMAQVKNADIYGGWYWKSNGVAKNIKLTSEIIEQFEDKLQWDAFGISDNETLTFEILEKYKDKDWSIFSVCLNSFKQERIRLCGY